MKTTGKSLSASLAAIALCAGLAQAAVLSINDFSQAPDGSSTRFQQATNINILNGGNVLGTSGTAVYMVTTFTFGTGTSADIAASFDASSGHAAERIGVRIQNTGIVDSWGTGGSNLTTFNMGGSVVGQTITILAKFQFDTNNSVTYTGIVPNTPGSADDTLMNVWINPTGTSVEGSGITAGDLYALWNSSNFAGFDQSIWNDTTPGTAGVSSITDTVVLTGSDATFANALALAIPEPSAALLGGLGLLALLRRRRTA